MKKDITELYCCVENFCRAVDDNFANRFLSNGKKPTRVPEIAHSEILTIILLYHKSPCCKLNYNAPHKLDQKKWLIRVGR